jgi:hypothetical protein
MKYLVILKSGHHFLTHWFEVENHWNKEEMLLVINLHTQASTKDGVNWEFIKEDHL